MLSLTLTGNILGCVLIAFMCKGGLLFDDGKDSFLLYMVRYKLSLQWYVVFIRGIFANWFVGIATWMVASTNDFTGKACAVWLPIFSFAAIGFEHCVANAFILFMAFVQDHTQVSALDYFWRNMIPSILGNYIGGSVLVAAFYSFIYGNPNLCLSKDRFIT
jgi:formate/nitrite transporter FocA (FNT family)